jgi:maltooligosyltrehalose trehalohydrolase
VRRLRLVGSIAASEAAQSCHHAPNRHREKMTGRLFGPVIEEDGVVFRLWAPTARSVSLICDGQRPMLRRPDGWFGLKIFGAGPGSLYRFEIDGELQVPDPASHFQPEDVHGPSEVIEHPTPAIEADWKGRPWHECIFSEIHTGTFTPEGTFRSAIEKLDHLAAAGFTAVELMPIADFPGRWNWGYDGVLPFAPDSSYGRPEDLKALIQAAHDRGLMMFLDVVYNHFGPEGNYIGRYAPAFFADAQTPWGSAIDYRVPEVRAFAIENALHWLDHYGFDGLRLDAVHAIPLPGTPSILQELSIAVGTLAASTGRSIHLVLENDDNEANLLDPITDPPSGCYRAQWNDDYHHVFHVHLSADTHGYYRDYQDVSRQLPRTVSQGFAYQGEASAHRDGAPRGKPSAGLPATAFVNFLQNHDQIGNRALGERLEELTQPAAIEAALAVMLLAPAPPMMFMGDEWGTRRRFPYFCDFSGELGDAVRQGRRREFAEAYEKHGADVPDPLSAETVRQATLDWNEVSQAPHRDRLELVRRLLSVRRKDVVPLLPLVEAGSARASMDGALLDASWDIPDRARRLRLLANLGPDAAPAPALDHPTAIWGTLTSQLPGWTVLALLEHA